VGGVVGKAMGGGGGGGGGKPFKMITNISVL
jgi:hypothetical protein